MALRLFIHLFGDIHQPLHCMNRVDQDWPEGDAGGNDFILPYHYDVDELHALWDATIYEYHDSIKLPFVDATWKDIGNDSSSLYNMYKFSSADIQTWDFDSISHDSYITGDTYAYENIVMN